jgi:hypothetical protein
MTILGYIRGLIDRDFDGESPENMHTRRLKADKRQSNGTEQHHCRVRNWSPKIVKQRQWNQAQRSALLR